MRLRWLEFLAVYFGDALSTDPRPLNELERATAMDVFGSSLDLDPIRIVRAWVVNSPVVLGHIIRIPPNYELDRITLIHELAHVWQYQHRGTAYISSSVAHQGWAMLTTGSRAAAYHLSAEDLTAPSIHHLPAEKQAVIIERWYASSLFRQTPDAARFIAEVRQRKTS
jgi:hypothetical protein